MIHSLNEKVKVLALFNEGGLKPLPFQWRGITYPVKEITFRWNISLDGPTGMVRDHHGLVVILNASLLKKHCGMN